VQKIILLYGLLENLTSNLCSQKNIQKIEKSAEIFGIEFSQTTFVLRGITVTEQTSGSLFGIRFEFSEYSHTRSNQK
jgi:hypothetical protein